MMLSPFKLAPETIAALEYILSRQMPPPASDAMGWGSAPAPPEDRWEPPVLSPLGGASEPPAPPAFQPPVTAPPLPMQGTAGPSAGSEWGGEAPPELPSYDAPELTPQVEPSFLQSALMQVLGNVPMFMPQRGAYGKYPSGFDRFAGVAGPLLARGVAGGIAGGIQNRQAAVNAKNAAATGAARAKFESESIGYKAAMPAWASRMNNIETNQTRRDLDNPPVPEKSLSRIEAEAEARARGGRKGAPPIGRQDSNPLPPGFQWSKSAAYRIPLIERELTSTRAKLYDMQYAPEDVEKDPRVVEIKARKERMLKGDIAGQLRSAKTIEDAERIAASVKAYFPGVFESPSFKQVARDKLNEFSAGRSGGTPRAK